MIGHSPRQTKQTAEAEYDSNIETEIYEKGGDLFGWFSGRQCLKPFSGSAWSAYRQPGLADAFDDQGLSSLREDDGRHRRHSTRTLFPGWLRRRIFISREWKRSHAHPRRSRHEIGELSFHDGRAAQDPAKEHRLGERSWYHANHHRDIGRWQQPDPRPGQKSGRRIQ